MAEKRSNLITTRVSARVKRLIRVLAEEEQTTVSRLTADVLERHVRGELLVERLPTAADEQACETQVQVGS